MRAIVNPLRGVALDAAYVASAIDQIPGPVLAVGHSYGGAIITNAVPQTINVVGLVYVVTRPRRRRGTRRNRGEVQRQRARDRGPGQ